MKVIGTGAPEVLTARLERCELDPLLADLRGERGVVTDALMHEVQRAAAAPSEAGAEELDRLHGELFELSRLIDEVEQAEARADEPVAITGPTSLMAQVLRGTAIEAAERLVAALTAAYEPGRRVSPESVRAAGLAAHACANTWCDYYFVDNHGLCDGLATRC